jgi:hypothetical protein
MSKVLPTTIRIVTVEPINQDKVRVLVELMVDPHRLVELCTDMLRVGLKQTGNVRKRPDI